MTKSDGFLVPESPPPRRSSRYDGLARFLEQCTLDSMTLSFGQIEEILGCRLPRSAFDHPEWWANNRGTHTQSAAWLDHGWRTENVNVSGQRVTFARVK